MLAKTFYISLISTIIVVATVLASLPAPSNSTGASPISNNSLLIKNVTIFDGKNFIGQSDIEIKHGVIQNIANKIEADGRLIIEGEGRVVIPGLIDAHTHTYGEALSSALNFGVTTQVDMFSPPSLLPATIKQRINTEQNSKADLFSAGMLATVKGGHGTQFGIEVDTIDQSTDIEQWIDNRIEEGSDFIKLVYMPYSSFFKSIDRATATNIIKHAHARNLKVVAHISSLQAARELLEDDIDGFVHIFADEIADQAFLEQARAKNIFVIPTLSVIASASQKPYGSELAADPLIAPFLKSDQEQQLKSGFGEHMIPGFDFDIALENTRLLHKAGVPILAGSDAPNPGTSYGASIHQELELLELAGLETTDALRSATSEVAKLFNIKGRGVITKGANADLVILSSNKLESIASSRKIDTIYKNGRLVNRGLAEEKTESVPITNPTLSQFEIGLNTDNGFVWSKTDDTLANGTSHASILTTDQVLSVDASVGSGFMFPWAGAGGFTDQARDISRFKQVQFRIRGTVGQYQAMMFATSTAGAPPSQTFEVTDQWNAVTLDLTNFRGLDMSNFIGVAVVAGPKLGEFKYQLDDVKLVP